MYLSRFDRWLTTNSYIEPDYHLEAQYEDQFYADLDALTEYDDALGIDDGSDTEQDYPNA